MLFVHTLILVTEGTLWLQHTFYIHPHISEKITGIETSFPPDGRNLMIFIIFSNLCLMLF